MADRMMGKEAASDAKDREAAKSPKAKGTPSPAESTSGRAEDADADSEKVVPGSDADGALKTVAAELLKKGDLAALAEKLGVDKKAVDASSAKLRLARQREEKATAATRDAESKMKEAQELRDSAKREYGAPHKARAAYDKGDFHEAAQWISHVLGEDFAAVTRNVANATKGMDEKELKRFQKDRELKQREEALAAKEKAAEQKVTEEQRTARALKAIDAKCAGHDVLKLKGGNRLVMRILEDAFDPKTGAIGIGYKQAADQVLAEFVENAKAIGLTAAKAAVAAEAAEPAPKPKPPDTPRGRKEFPSDKGREDDAGAKRKGSSLEERRARADRMFQRGRP